MKNAKATLAIVLLLLVMGLAVAGNANAASGHHKRAAVVTHKKSKHHKRRKRTKPKHKKPLVKAVIPVITPASRGTGGPLAPSLTPVAPVTPSTPGPAATPVIPTPPNPDRGSSLTTNESLTAGQYLVSTDAHYQLTMEATGDLVLTVNGRQLWHSNTAGNPGAWLVEQSDGNLVIYPAGQATNALWNAGTEN